VNRFSILAFIKQGFVGTMQRREEFDREYAKTEMRIAEGRRRMEEWDKDFKSRWLRIRT
jgi:hypothetical protein